jgi:hypothetical protein
VYSVISSSAFPRGEILPLVSFVGGSTNHSSDGVEAPEESRDITRGRSRCCLGMSRT